MPLTLKNFNKTTPPIIPLNFTANAVNSAVRINKTGSPTAVTFEYSTDNSTWSTYTFGTYIYLDHIWDKVYFRNTSESDTLLNLWNNDYYYFVISWSVSASWDVTTLLNKNWTDTVWSYCFLLLFVGCTGLTTPPSMPATNLSDLCYQYMFLNCSGLEALPNLPALTVPYFWYRGMFQSCSKIKLSTSKTWEYVNEYRIPTSWTGTVWKNGLLDMFSGTWGSFTWTPSINTTYYTSNTVV